MKTHSSRHTPPVAQRRAKAPSFYAWLLAGALLWPVGVRAAGVTIVTHGWNPSSSAPAWMAGLRDDIAAHFLGGAQNYGTITVTKPAGSLVATCSPWNVDLSGGTNSDILILLDWSAVANHLTGGPTAQAVAAVVIDKLVTGQNGQRPLAELPIHLIGHSRGGGMVCELARLLGERGIVVDQLTPLDPHPLTASDPQPSFPLPAVIDTPAAIYQNVVFADVYSQTGEYPTGQSITGGYNRQWSALPGGYYNNSSPNNVYANHRNVLLLYQATINYSSPLYNGEATLLAADRAAWFNAYEAAGTNTGFTYSRIDGGGNWASTNQPVAGGDSIRAGLNNATAFGGGGSRSALTWSAAVWPNVAKLDVLTNGTTLGSGTSQITIGSTQQLRYAYFDYSNTCTVTLYLDADRNPYNSNNATTISTQAIAAATGSTFAQNTVNWDTHGIAAGSTGYVYAAVSDGTHTRYFYASPQLVFAQDTGLPQVSITNAPGSVAYTVTNCTISGTNNAYVVGLMRWTNNANSANGTIAAANPWQITAIALATGANQITVYGSNAAGALASDSVTVTRSNGPATRYVWLASPTPTSPYTNWVTAAHTIQDAVNAAVANDTVLVTNGVYAAGGATTESPAISNRVSIRAAITVQSVNGPSVTIIQGAPDPVTGGLGTNATRCAFLSASGGLLSGFTLTNGYTRTDGDWNLHRGGGGALVKSGVISNCVVTACAASYFGGGLDLFGGSAWNCTVSKGTAYDGGGLYLQYGGSAFNCLIYSNSATNMGGGARFSQDGKMVNCTVAGNRAVNGGGGVYCYQGGTNLNCILYSNTNNGAANNYTTNAGGLFTCCCTTPNPGGAGNFTNDPVFVNVAASNYRLQSTSPCVDTGTNQTWMDTATDLAGLPRVLGVRVDVGAYECAGAPVVDITTADANVSRATTNYTIDGTINSWVVGTLVWTNPAASVGGALSALTPWSIAGIALAPGPNAITVSGTNIAGTFASDTVTITRDPNAGPGSPTHYVWLDSPAPAWPYTNWASAAHTIQEAVDTADTADTVLVTNGVYAAGGKVTPGGSLPNRVCITANITVQSVNGPSGTLVVGVGPIGTSAMRCAYLTAGTLSGFTLTNGFTQFGDWTRDENGGGAFLRGGGTVSNCVVTGCTAYDCGGGISVLNNGTVNNCTIAGNASRSLDTAGAGMGGGGVVCCNGGTLNNCVIRDNRASQSSYGGGAGGGVDCEEGGTVNNCIVSNNIASENGGGGGVYCWQGGSVRNCTLCNNASPGGQGGGILCDYGGATVQNCLLYGNASGNGAGLYSSQSVTVRNCTFTGNTNSTSDDGTGIFLRSGGTAQNCIIFGNRGSGANIYNPAGGVISYSCSPGLSGSGNITNDPVFVNPAANNFRLAAGSHCIDAGTNAFMPSATDLDGTPRPLDGDANGTAIVDMGCYEHLNSSADSNGDGIPDGWAAAHGLNPTQPGDAANDPDGDGCNNWQEYNADTDPANAASYFHIESVTNLPPLTVTFLSSSNRVYSLCAATNLDSAPWTVIAGQSNVVGTGGLISLSDTNTAVVRFYRVNVALP